MRRHHRLTLWVIAGVHLLVAVLTYRAGVPIASPVVLAVAALVAFGFGCTRPPRSDGNGHPQLGRADAAFRSTTRDEGDGPGAA